MMPCFAHILTLKRGCLVCFTLAECVIFGVEKSSINIRYAGAGDKQSLENIRR